MHLVKRSCALVSVAVLTTALLAAAPSSAAAGTRASDPGRAQTPRAANGQILLNWELIALRTVYTDSAPPIPVGVPVLGFTSLAMHRAVQASLSRHRSSSERAAVIAAG